MAAFTQGPHTHRIAREVHSSAPLCCLALRGPRVGRWGGGRPVQEDSGFYEGSSAVLVSEVKFVQVPCALPTLRAPHSAVIALQLFLPLAFLLGLFSSWHQDIEEDLLEVSCVLISQPACTLFSSFSPRADNFDLNFPCRLG